jgi:hypothetical protein
MADRQTLISRNRSQGVAPVRPDTSRADPSAFGVGGATAQFGQDVAQTGNNIIRYGGLQARAQEALASRRTSDFNEKLRLIATEENDALDQALVDPLDKAAPGTQVEITEQVSMEARKRYDARITEAKEQFQGAEINDDVIERTWSSIAGDKKTKALVLKATTLKQDTVDTAMLNASNRMNEAVGANPTDIDAFVRVYDENRAHLAERMDRGEIDKSDYVRYESKDGRQDLFNAIQRAGVTDPTKITPALVDSLVKSKKLDVDQGVALLRSVPAMKGRASAHNAKVFKNLLDTARKTGSATELLNNESALAYMDEFVTDSTTGEQSRDLIAELQGDIQIAVVQGRLNTQAESGFIPDLSLALAGVSPKPIEVVFDDKGNLQVDQGPNAVARLAAMQEATQSPAAFASYLDRIQPGASGAFTASQMATLTQNIANQVGQVQNKIASGGFNEIAANNPAVRAAWDQTDGDPQAVGRMIAAVAKAQGVPSYRQVNVHPAHLTPLVTAIKDKDAKSLQSYAPQLISALGVDAPNAMASLANMPALSEQHRKRVAALHFLAGTGLAANEPLHDGIRGAFEGMLQAVAFREERDGAKLTALESENNQKQITELDATLARQGAGDQTPANIRLALSSQYANPAVAEGFVDLMRDYNLFLAYGKTGAQRNAGKSSREVKEAMDSRYTVIRAGAGPTDFTLVATMDRKEDNWGQRPQPGSNIPGQSGADYTAALHAIVAGPALNTGAPGQYERIERNVMFGMMGANNEAWFKPHTWLGAWELDRAPGLDTRFMSNSLNPIPEDLRIPYERLYAKRANALGGYDYVSPAQKIIVGGSEFSQARQAAADYLNGKEGAGDYSRNAAALGRGFQFVDDPESGGLVLYMKSGSVFAEGAGSTGAGRDPQPLYFMDESGKERQFVVPYDKLQSFVYGHRKSRALFQSKSAELITDRLPAMFQDMVVTKDNLDKLPAGLRAEYEAEFAKREAGGTQQKKAVGGFLKAIGIDLTNGE